MKYQYTKTNLRINSIAITFTIKKMRSRKYLRVGIPAVLLLLFVILLKVIVRFETASEQSNIKTFWDALWYSAVTLTTVGYGDNYPVTPQGKILGLIIILGSLGLLGYLIGNVTNLIQHYMEKKKEGFYGTSFTNHFVIIGWNNFGRMVAEQVLQAGNKICIVTDNKADIDLINEIFPPDEVFVLFTDINKYEAYEKVAINQSRSVFINLNDDTETLVFMINMKKYYTKVAYVVSVNKAELKETFQSVGVKYALAKNEIASKLVASYIFEPDVGFFTEDLISTSVNEKDFDIQQYRINATNPFLNADYMDTFVEVKKQFDAVLLGVVKIQNAERTILKNPTRGTLINENDYLILISDGVNKKKIEEAFGVCEGLM